jgi:hypothetical protein
MVGETQVSRCRKAMPRALSQLVAGGVEVTHADAGYGSTRRRRTAVPSRPTSVDDTRQDGYHLLPANGWVVCLVLVNRKIVDPVVRLSGNVELPDGVRIQDFNLVYRQDFYLRFLSVKFDFSGDADDFSLERGNLLVSRNF